MPFSVVTARARFDNTGAMRELPLLVCGQGAVVPVVDYCLTRDKSLSWMENVTRSAKLLCQYVEAQGNDSIEDNWKIFRNFSTCLRLGTVDPTTGIDPSGLYWEPRTEREVGRIIRVLTDMLGWLSREYHTNADTFNPLYEGTALDRRIERLAYLHRKCKSFLNHTWLDEKQESEIHLIRPRNSRKKLEALPPRFPDDRFPELLFKGFIVAGKPDYRGMLISLLLDGGGLRESEPFHLYVADVQPGLEDSSIALVTIHHPQDGIAPYGFKNHLGKRGTRAQYLATYGLVPRNLLRKNAGWKNNAEDGDGYMQVHWFPEEYGRWFLSIWKRYVRTIAGVDRQHPYAFINLQGPSIGKPYSPQQFRRSFARAVRRIGLVPKKANGTTEHGCRHGYAWRLKKNGVSELFIQRLMHHGSPESQKVYTAPERKDIAAALKEAQQKLNEKSEFPGVLKIDDWVED